MRPTIPPSAVPEPVLELCDRLAASGYRSWVVGGCIRDVLMGKRVADWDLCTDATPEQVSAVFRRTIPTGIAHGTVTVLHRGGSYEVTTLRGEGAYSDGRRPDSVHFVADLEEDLARRDFTVNAIAYDPRTDALIDPWHGVSDIEHRVVRAVRDPRERFDEDGLRVLRAARFVATLEFVLDPATEAAIAATLPTFRKVSPERVRDEWDKTLSRARRPSRAFEVMRRSGMLAISAPSLASLGESTFARAMERVDAAAKRVPLRVAALLLEVDAPPRELDAWMRGMRFSNEERQTTLALLEHQPAVAAAEQGDDRELRRFLARVGRRHVAEVVALDHADRVARGASIEPIAALGARIDAVFASGAPLTTGELAITGKDVMDRLGTGPGRYVGEILSALLREAVDDPGCNTREALLARVVALAPGGVTG